MKSKTINGLRECRLCGDRKPVQQFYIRKSGVVAIDCKDCELDANKKWRKKTGYKNGPWYKKNPMGARLSVLRRIYGLSEDAYNALLKQQKNACAICGGVNENGKWLAVDHDHKTGRVRGLLCMRCNNGLGCFSDDDAKLIKAIEYLRGVRWE